MKHDLFDVASSYSKHIKPQSLLLLRLLDMTKSLQNEIICKAKTSIFFLGRCISPMHHPLPYICLATFVSNRPKTLKIVVLVKKQG